MLNNYWWRSCDIKFFSNFRKRELIYRRNTGSWWRQMIGYKTRSGVWTQVPIDTGTNSSWTIDRRCVQVRTAIITVKVWSTTCVQVKILKLGTALESAILYISWVYCTCATNREHLSEVRYRCTAPLREELELSSGK